MRTEDDRLLHQAVRDFLCQVAAQTTGGDACDDTILDVLDEWLVNVLQARCSEMQVLEPHLSQLVDHHIHHLVASAEVVVERNRHAVLQSAAADSLLERTEFRLIMLHVGARSDILRATFFLIDGHAHALCDSLNQSFAIFQCIHNIEP